MGFFDRKISEAKQPSTIWQTQTQLPKNTKAWLNHISRGYVSWFSSTKTILTAVGLISGLGMLYYTYKQRTLPKTIALTQDPISSLTSNPIGMVVQVLFGGAIIILPIAFMCKQPSIRKITSEKEDSHEDKNFDVDTSDDDQSGIQETNIEKKGTDKLKNSDVNPSDGDQSGPERTTSKQDDNDDNVSDLEFNQLCDKISNLNDASNDIQLEKVYKDVFGYLNSNKIKQLEDRQKVVQLLVASIIERFKMAAKKDDQGTFIHDLNEDIKASISDIFDWLLDNDKSAVLEIAKTCVFLLDLELENLTGGGKFQRIFYTNTEPTISKWYRAIIKLSLDDGGITKKDLLDARKMSPETISNALNQFLNDVDDDRIVEFINRCEFFDEIFQDTTLELAKASILFLNGKKYFDLVDIAKVYDSISLNTIEKNHLVILNVFIEDYSQLPYEKPITELKKVCQKIFHSAVRNSKIRRSLFSHCIDQCDNDLEKYNSYFSQCQNTEAFKRFEKVDPFLLTNFVLSIINLDLNIESLEALNALTQFEEV